jgi:hypothetical protein
MIGYIVKIVKIVDDTSKDQHALISTRRRRHRELLCTDVCYIQLYTMVQDELFVGL